MNKRTIIISTIILSLTTSAVSASIIRPPSLLLNDLKTITGVVLEKPVDPNEMKKLEDVRDKVSVERSILQDKINAQIKSMGDTTVIPTVEKKEVTPEEVLASLTELLNGDTKLVKFYQDKETDGDTYYISLEGTSKNLNNTIHKIASKYEDISDVKLISLRLDQDIYDSKRDYDDDSRMPWFKGQVINSDKSVVNFQEIEDKIEERKTKLEEDSKYESIETAKEAELLKLDELIDSSIDYYNYLIDREEKLLLLQDESEQKSKVSEIFNSVFGKTKNKVEDEKEDEEEEEDKDKEEDEKEKEDAREPESVMSAYSSISKYEEKITQLEQIRTDKKAEIEKKWDEKKTSQDEAEELKDYIKNITLLPLDTLPYKGDLVLKFE